MILNEKNRIKILKKNLKIKFFRGRHFKILANYTTLAYLKSPSELQILDNIQKMDFNKGFKIKIPKKKIVDFESFGILGKFIVITSDGGVYLYDKQGKIITMLELLTSKKSKEFSSSVAVCPKSKFVAISTTRSFPSSKASRENIYFLKLTGNRFVVLNKINVFSEEKSSNFYSLRFYPKYVNKKPVVYGVENDASRSLCCYSFDEVEDKFNVLKIEVEGFHNSKVWGLKDDGVSLWSIDDKWCLKNLFIEEF